MVTAGNAEVSANMRQKRDSDTDHERRHDVESPTEDGERESH
jgi:hypothetical protein